MICLAVISCDSSNTGLSNTSSSKSEASNSTQPDKTSLNSKVILYTKTQLESVLPKRLGVLKRSKMSVIERPNGLQAKSLYLSNDAKPKSIKINLFDLSKFKGDKSQIQIYGQINSGIFNQIDEKKSDRFTRSEKISGYPAVIEETSVEMFGEEYKDSKLAILFDHRLYVEMEGSRLTVKELQSVVRYLNLKLLPSWNF